VNVQSEAKNIVFDPAEKRAKAREGNVNAMIETIAFDADDTLWQNETFFRLTQDRFAALLADYADPDHLHDRLQAAERRNLGHYGFGIKGFTLSMIETAIEVTEHRVPASVIAELIAAGQDMLRHPIHLLPEAHATVERLAANFEIVLITKGDLLDQERKLAQSGLGDLFDRVEIVSDKTPAVYESIFKGLAGGSTATMMVGNSMKSDVLPVLEVGGWAVHVPHALTWDYERAETPREQLRFWQIETLGELPGVIDAIYNSAQM
jgi:putative hydrolase of the HAD superfamily